MTSRSMDAKSQYPGREGIGPAEIAGTISYSSADEVHNFQSGIKRRNTTTCVSPGIGPIAGLDRKVRPASSHSHNKGLGRRTHPEACSLDVEALGKIRTTVSVCFHETGQLTVLNHRNDSPTEKQLEVLNESISNGVYGDTPNTVSSGVWFHVTDHPERGEVSS